MPDSYTKADHRTLTLREALLLLLDQVDYTAGACRVSEQVGDVLSPNVLTLVKAALVKDLEQTMPTEESVSPKCS